MGDVVGLPESQHFLICNKCSGTSWNVCWPKDEEDRWYIECMDCGKQFLKSVLPCYGLRGTGAD